MALAEVKAAGFFAKLFADAMGWLIMVVLIVALGLMFWGQQRQISAIKTERGAAVATTAASKAAYREQVTYIREKAVRDEATQEVLDRQPEYRDAVVPADVADRFRERL